MNLHERAVAAKNSAGGQNGDKWTRRNRVSSGMNERESGSRVQTKTPRGGADRLQNLPPTQQERLRQEVVKEVK